MNSNSLELIHLYLNSQISKHTIFKLRILYYVKIKNVKIKKVHWYESCTALKNVISQYLVEDY